MHAPIALALVASVACLALSAVAGGRPKPDALLVRPFPQDVGHQYTRTDGLARARAAGVALTAVSAEGRAPEGLTVPVGSRVNCMAVDDAGHLWVGTDKGIGIHLPGEWQVQNGATGLPILDVRVIVHGKDGSTWVGTEQGVARLYGGAWSYYAGKRWLPDDRVKALGVSGSGDAWVETESGVGHIEFRNMTFAQKAEHFQRLTDTRHKRLGYVANCGLTRPGDLTSFVYDASDNDGLWTALHIVAMSMRWGATRDPKARAAARESMNALLFLSDVTGIPGFMARAVKRKDEKCSGYSPDDPNWNYVNPRYPDFFWKDDTSSDEVDGHFLAWYVYHELVATEPEKKRIAATCRATMNHIIDNGFYLIGPSGRHTTWGVWAPEQINDNRRWSEEHGLNALEILSHLKVAIHICGDAKFRDAYRDLVEKHHYALNTVEQKVMPPHGSNNHSDDELAWCAYYPLLMLETEPALRRLYLMSLERTQRILQPEGSPFYNFLYAALTGSNAGVEDGVEWLRRAPLDTVEWTMRNSHRADVEIERGSDRFGRPEATRVLPISERVFELWNSNPYRLDGGNGGMGEVEGTPWLLPYWFGRYHGVIAEASPKG